MLPSLSSLTLQQLVTWWGSVLIQCNWSKEVYQVEENWLSRLFLRWLNQFCHFDQCQSSFLPLPRPLLFPVESLPTVSLCWSKSGKVIPHSLWLRSHQTERKIIISHQMGPKMPELASLISYSLCQQGYPFSEARTLLAADCDWPEWARTVG